MTPVHDVVLRRPDPVGLGGGLEAGGVDDAALLSSLHLATAALMWLAPVSPGLDAGSVAAALSALRVSDPVVVSYSTMALWGLGHNESNRVAAVNYLTS